MLINLVRCTRRYPSKLDAYLASTGIVVLDHIRPAWLTFCGVLLHAIVNIYFTTLALGYHTRALDVISQPHVLQRRRLPGSRRCMRPLITVNPGQTLK